MTTATAPLLDLLSWIAARPRSYRETIEAWRSNCPRLSVWDDACAAGLVRVLRDGGPMDEAAVVLTEAGRELFGDSGAGRTFVATA
jgi:hypothetical protein